MVLQDTPVLEAMALGVSPETIVQVDPAAAEEDEVDVDEELVCSDEELDEAEELVSLDDADEAELAWLAEECV